MDSARSLKVRVSALHTLILLPEKHAAEITIRLKFK